MNWSFAPAAHMTVQGANAFSSGLLHPLLTPSHVLVLLALALSAGQHVPLRLGPELKAFAPFSAIALLLTITETIRPTPQAALICIALGAAALVTLEKRLPVPVTRAVFAAAGAAIGLDSGVTGGSTLGMLMTLLGTWISLEVLLVNFAFYVSLAAERKKKWITIGIRILGSWIFAISLLVLAFSVRR